MRWPGVFTVGAIAMGLQGTPAVSPPVHAPAGVNSTMRALFAVPSRTRTATVMSTVRLKPGHVQPVWAGHPWIYAQAVDSVEAGVATGDEVRVVDPRGNLLGRGFYSAGSAIPVRILGRDETTQFDAAFFRGRFERAIALGLPGGLAEDAYARLVEARSRAGDGAGARAAASEYAQKYPNGSRASTIQRWVGD